MLMLSSKKLIGGQGCCAFYGIFLSPNVHTGYDQDVPVPMILIGIYDLYMSLDIVAKMKPCICSICRIIVATGFKSVVE